MRGEAIKVVKNLNSGLDFYIVFRLYNYDSLSNIRIHIFSRLLYCFTLFINSSINPSISVCNLKKTSFVRMVATF